MLLKFVFTVFAFLVVGSSTFASDSGVINGDLQNQSRTYNDNRYWQCHAASVHGGHHEYDGQVSYSRHEARHSALQACRYQEGHNCQITTCYRTSGY